MIPFYKVYACHAYVTTYPILMTNGYIITGVAMNKSNVIKQGYFSLVTELECVVILHKYVIIAVTRYILYDCVIE